MRHLHLCIANCSNAAQSKILSTTQPQCCTCSGSLLSPQTNMRSAYLNRKTLSCKSLPMHGQQTSGSLEQRNHDMAAGVTHRSGGVRYLQLPGPFKGILLWMPLRCCHGVLPHRAAPSQVKTIAETFAPCPNASYCMDSAGVAYSIAAHRLTLKNESADDYVKGIKCVLYLPGLHGRYVLSALLVRAQRRHHKEVFQMLIPIVCADRQPCP